MTKPPSGDDFESFWLLAVDDGEYAELDRLLREHPTIHLDDLVVDDADGRLLDRLPSYPPSPEVWERIERQVNSLEGGTAPESRKTQPGRLAIAIGSMAAVVLLAVGAVVMFSWNQPSGTELFAAEAAALLDNGEATVLKLTDPSTATTAAKVVVDDDGTAYFVFSDLDALTQDQTYQLWAVADGAVVSAALLGPDGEAVPLRLEAEPEVLAVTVEQAGGVVVSEQAPVAVWAAGS